MNTIQFSSLLSLLAGILIIVFPNILEYLVAVVLIVIGINGMIFGARFNKMWRVKLDK